MRRLIGAVVLLGGVAVALPAQDHAMGGMQHGTMGGMQHEMMMGSPAPAGQAAFAAIGDIVRQLKADSTTDWSKVNLEALRQHLIDMDDVVLRSSVKAVSVDGGLAMDITGDGRVADAIKRMVAMHAPMLDQLPDYHATATAIPQGMHLVVTAKGGDARTVQMIRGLGFAGLLTEGEHHAAHHLMVASGSMNMSDHRH
jgi:hypothetical protein